MPQGCKKVGEHGITRCYDICIYILFPRYENYGNLMNIFVSSRENVDIFLELCRFSTNCTFAGQCIFRTMPRHGLRDEFKADRASGRRAGRLRFQDGAACIPRLIIPAIFYYGRAFIYHARIVNRGTLHRGREEPRVPIRSTAGLNQIRPLSYIIVCPSTTLAIQFFFFTFLNLIQRLYIL